MCRNFKDGFWFVRLSFISVVKFYSLAQFPDDFLLLLLLLLLLESNLKQLGKARTVN